MLKFLNQESRYRFIASGSQLGVAYILLYVCRVRASRRAGDIAGTGAAMTSLHRECQIPGLKEEKVGVNGDNISIYQRFSLTLRKS